MKIEFVGEMSKLTLGYRDVLVVTTDICITEQQAETIKERVRAALKRPDAPVLVLGEGLRVTALDMAAI